MKTTSKPRPSQIAPRQPKTPVNAAKVALGSPESPYLSNGTVKPERSWENDPSHPEGGYFVSAETRARQAEAEIAQTRLQVRRPDAYAPVQPAATAPARPASSAKQLLRAEIRSLGEEVKGLRAELAAIERRYGNTSPWSKDSYREEFYLGSGNGSFNPLRYQAHLDQVERDKAAYAPLQTALETKSAQLALKAAELANL